MVGASSMVGALSTVGGSGIPGALVKVRARAACLITCTHE